MSSNDVLIALACFTLTILVVAPLWRAARRRAQRRARRLHDRRADRESPLQHAPDESPARYGAITPERARAIRREAERAARLAAATPGVDAANPYPRGTPEFVLWVTTYHLTLTELDEEAAAAHGA
jgi:hypothetical protein